MEIMERPRILTVDDRPSITMTFRRLLERAGYAVKEENDSTRALQVARTFKPHLILLDFFMPGMDGCEVAQQLAKDEDLRATPVAFVSGGSENEISAKLNAPNCSFLPKPVEFGMLFDFVREHIGHAA